MIVDLGIDGFEQAVKIGSGGFAVVYRAWQPDFARFVAIKVVSVTLESPEVDRFSRECAAIGALSGHPNIVTVYGSGRTKAGLPFIVMEHLDGGSLADRIARQPMEWVEALEVGVKLAGALSAAHGADVLHRDVKPENVLVSHYGDCKLGDFGIARVGGLPQTRTGVATASWAHAPPEIVEGRPPSVASDVYALASTLFTLVAGSPPFVRPTDEGWAPMLARIIREPVPDLRRTRPGLPDSFVRVIEHGLSKPPGERPASAAELARALQGVQEEFGLAVTRVPRGANEQQTTGRSVPGPDPSGRPTTPGTNPPPDRRSKRPGFTIRLAPVIGAVAVVTAALVVGLVLSKGAGQTAGGTNPASTSPSTIGAGGGTTPTSGAPTAGRPAPTAATAQGTVALGRDLLPVSTDSCRSAGSGSGAAWQLGSVRMGGRPFDLAYACNLFAGAAGSLDFVLGGSFRSMSVTVGFADDSVALVHTVRFEIVGDSREYLTPPVTLTFGQVQTLDFDVSRVTRVQMKVTELGDARGTGSASRPAFASATLVRS